MFIINIDWSSCSNAVKMRLNTEPENYCIANVCCVKIGRSLYLTRSFMCKIQCENQLLVNLWSQLHSHPCLSPTRLFCCIPGLPTPPSPLFPPSSCENHWESSTFPFTLSSSLPSSVSLSPAELSQEGGREGREGRGGVGVESARNREKGGLMAMGGCGERDFSLSLSSSWPSLGPRNRSVWFIYR